MVYYEWGVPLQPRMSVALLDAVQGLSLILRLTFCPQLNHEQDLVEERNSTAIPRLPLRSTSMVQLQRTVNTARPPQLLYNPGQRLRLQK